MSAQKVVIDMPPRFDISAPLEERQFDDANIFKAITSTSRIPGSHVFPFELYTKNKLLMQCRLIGDIEKEIDRAHAIHAAQLLLEDCSCTVIDSPLNDIIQKLYCLVAILRHTNKLLTEVTKLGVEIYTKDARIFVSTREFSVFQFPNVNERKFVPLSHLCIQQCGCLRVNCNDGLIYHYNCDARGTY